MGDVCLPGLERAGPDAAMCSLRRMGWYRPGHAGIVERQTDLICTPQSLSIERSGPGQNGGYPRVWVLCLGHAP